MAVSDDKQNRLSTLSQDVIAVPKKPAASVSANRSTERSAEPSPNERKPIPPTQDVFKVSSGSDEAAFVPVARTAIPQSPPPPVPPRAAGNSVSGARSKVRNVPPAAPSAPSAMQLATGVVAALALLLALYGVMREGTAVTSVDAAVVEKLTQDLHAANERVAKLEMALSAAATDSQQLNSPGQANVLQISAGMRQLRNDIDVLSNDMARVSTEIGELRSLAGNSSGQAKLAASQVEQLAARVATLKEQLATAPRAAAAPAPAASGGAASAELQAQVKTLTARTEKMAADIRQLYRLAGGQ